jgi:hypothetical protein
MTTSLGELWAAAADSAADVRNHFRLVSIDRFSLTAP